MLKWYSIKRIKPGLVSKLILTRVLKFKMIFIKIEVDGHTHTQTYMSPCMYSIMPLSCQGTYQGLAILWSAYGIKNKITVIIIFMSFHITPLPLFSLLFISSLESNSPCLVSWMPEVTDGDFLVSSPQLLNAEKVNSSCAYRPHFNHQGCIPAPVF